MSSRFRLRREPAGSPFWATAISWATRRTSRNSIAGFLEAEFEAAGYDLDVLNFAVSGHGTAEMILQFENLAAGFAPDVTVFQFHGSDYDDNIRADLFRLAPGGGVVATGGTYLPAVGVRARLESIPAYRWMSEHSQIYSGLREKAAVYVKNLLAAVSLRANAAEGADGGAADAAGGYRLTAALIAEARRVTEATGSSWYLFDVPARRSRTEFVSLLGSADLPPDLMARTISPLPAFEANAALDVKLFYEKGHLHFTPLGNRLAAETLFDRIQSDSGARLAKCRSAA